MIITQTGGGCRASNYIGFIRRALEKAGCPEIPVISLNLSGLEENPGFKLTFPLLQRGLYALIFGDMLFRSHSNALMPRFAFLALDVLPPRCSALKLLL